MKRSQPRAKIYSLFAVIVMCWALSWVVGKFALSYIPILYLTTLRLVIATACFFLLAYSYKKLALLQAKDLPIILSIGILQFFLFTLLSLWGLKYIGAGQSAMLAYTAPIWISLYTYLFLKEPLSNTKKCSVALGGIAIMLLLEPLSINWQNNQLLFGNLMLVLAAISWALAILSARYMIWHKSVIEMVPWQFLVASILSIPLCYMNGSMPSIQWTVTLTGAVLFLSVIATAFGFWGSVVIAKELPPITTSLGLLGVPFLSLILSHYILHEPITFEKLLALIFILAALGISVYDDSRSPERQVE